MQKTKTLSFKFNWNVKNLFNNIFYTTKNKALITNIEYPLHYGLKKITYWVLLFSFGFF